VAETAPAETPADPQLAVAQTAATRACALYEQARTAAHTARGAYVRARHLDPAAQTTDQTRTALREALHAEVDAQLEAERAQDELTALHRQTTETPDA
jgi:hypothetical protein